MPRPRPLVISVEGGIGAGKSTLLQLMKRLFAGKMGIAFVDEPVDEWIDEGFLAGMYDGSISAAAFQHMVLQSLAGDLLKAVADWPVVIITERSPFSNYHVFGKANLTAVDLRLYEFTWKRVMAGMISELDVRFLYLDADVETVKRRISERSRDCEAGVPDAYLEKIHRLHDEWLAAQDKCFRVDASGDKDAVLKASLDQISAWMLEAAAREVASREQGKERSPEEDAAILKDLSAACGLPV
tara:strand:- start:446 stop:1171 length:726 start_codon:yes stop_codon:yes gene_type:complete